MNTASARPGASWGGFSFAHVPMPSSSFPPLVWPHMVSRRHFCARIQRGRREVKRKASVKAICRPARRPCRPVVSLYSHSPKRPTAARTAPHKT
nr:MAG TPA: hypothetical protein [Caudoviricetes sp.]